MQNWHKLGLIFSWLRKLYHLLLLLKAQHLALEARRLWTFPSCRASYSARFNVLI